MLDMSSETTVQTVARIVGRVAEQHNAPSNIAMSDPLVEKGMTSMAMVDLMLAVEAEFDVTIPQREMTPANFQSMECLVALLERLQAR